MSFHKTLTKRLTQSLGLPNLNDFDQDCAKIAQTGCLGHRDTERHDNDVSLVNDNVPIH